ncbi:hypothetical protein [Lactobacillus panisapium]|uniref:hypothetical protein n=1 Tax=Lactobacillus panisapium TaxID=2012495 RepID=UPI0022E30457|nr:hypothetical protein [Lactobacillus panisapium]
MAKLSKQDKIAVFSLGQNYCIAPQELRQHYGIGIKRHNLIILDQLYIGYSSDFQKQAL